MARELATEALRLFATDPAGLGGIVLRGGPGPTRDSCWSVLRAALPASTPVKRVPAAITDDRLLGGLDLAATLAAGRPVAERGVLAQSDGGVIALAMAERLPARAVAHLCAVLDAGRLVVERDGFAQVLPAHLGVVAEDESEGDDIPLAAALRDRLAFECDLDLLDGALEPPGAAWLQGLALARTRLPAVETPPAAVEALCVTAVRLGIASLRGPLLALRAARVSAAWAGRNAPDDNDLALAAQLVLAPRATQLPPEFDDAREEPSPPDPGGADPTEAETEAPARDEAARPLDDVVIAAALAALPRNLLAAAAMQAVRAVRAHGRAGMSRVAPNHGRVIGHAQGDPRAGARLDLLATLRCAAPWQRLRAKAHHAKRRVWVQRDDFRVKRHRTRTQTATLFVVDASGSSALHRLGEAKGAVEITLADCYVRRDLVALISFRGERAELLLPPTRSLARARRSLAGLPAGGGTPLAAGIESAGDLAASLSRRGIAPLVVLLTDGRANVARAGQGRDKAASDALLAARALAATGTPALVIDTSARPHPAAQAIAAAMRARYVALPQAEASALSQAVHASATGGAARQAS